MLYGGEVWALSAEQLERLEVVQRGMLRSALPARLRRRLWDDRVSNRALLRYFKVPSVATLLLRRQLRWLGHLARMPEGRVHAMLLSGRRVLPGGGARGCRAPTLLGVFGVNGTYIENIRKHVESPAGQAFFGSRERWYVLAANRMKWKEFVNTREA